MEKVNNLDSKQEAFSFENDPRNGAVQAMGRIAASAEQLIEITQTVAERGYLEASDFNGFYHWDLLDFVQNGVVQRQACIEDCKPMDYCAYNENSYHQSGYASDRQMAQKESMWKFGHDQMGGVFHERTSRSFRYCGDQHREVLLTIDQEARERRYSLPKAALRPHGE